MGSLASSHILICHACVDSHLSDGCFANTFWLQANYRFLVSDGVDAKAFHADADRMLDWDDVIQVGPRH